MGKREGRREAETESGREGGGGRGERGLGLLAFALRLSRQRVAPEFTRRGATDDERCVYYDERGTNMAMECGSRAGAAHGPGMRS